MIAHDLSNVFFEIEPSYLFSKALDNFLNQMGSLDFKSIENGILSIYLFLSWLLSGLGIKNWLLMGVASCTGIFFILQKQKFSPSLSKRA